MSASDARRALIDGRLEPCGATIPVVRKDTGEPFAMAAMAMPSEVESAAAAAARAFHEMRLLPAYARAEILAKVRDGVSQRKEAIAADLAREAGKPIRAARLEVERALHTIGEGVAEASRLEGQVIPLDAVAHARDRLGMTRRFPVGPVLAITPFNFPLNLVAHKLVPAIAAGCSIVLKPASATPLSALHLAEIVSGSGAPPGAVNIVPCRAGDAERLAADPRFAVLTFTGSAAVGWRLRALAGRKKVVLELGGNAAVVVHDDADLSLAVPRIVAGGYGHAGQSCISVQRVLVERRVASELTSELVRRVKGLRMGDVMAEDTDLGPMIDEPAAVRAEAWIRDAERRGAKVLIGGGRRGPWLEPTVLAEVPHDAPVWCEEAFAPLVAVEPYDAWEDALRLVNASEYGLQAGIYTRDMGRIMQAWRDLEVGGVMVNEVPTWRVDHMPYGGIKGSGLGREGVRYAIEDMTETRLLALNLA